MSEDNKTLARRSWEVVDNLDILDEVYASDLVWHEPDQDVRGLEEAKRFVGMYKTAFPDLHATVEDAIAEGDKVAYRWTFRGTQQGELMGIPPTGNEALVSGTITSRLSGGRIEEEWNNFDQLGLLQQLGVVPTPGAAGG